MDTMNDEPRKNVVVYIGADYHDKLKALAERGLRTFGAQVEWLIEQEHNAQAAQPVVATPATNQS